MHKISLNEEQICKLIDFIESRGFHDPGVIVEVLDHFACKVEEKLTDNPNMTLESAMVSAHADFGVIGFYYLQANYEANTRKKYKTIYRAERKKVLLNPVLVIPALILAFLGYKAFLWAEINAIYWLGNMVGDLLFLAYMVVFILINVKFKARKRNNKLLESIMKVDIVGSFYFSLILGSVSWHHSPKSSVIFSILVPLLCFYVTIWALSIYATLKSGKQEMDEVYNYLDRNKPDKLNMAR